MVGKIDSSLFVWTGLFYYVFKGPIITGAVLEKSAESTKAIAS